MAWFNLSTRTTADANASADINVLMENIRVLGGNSTSAPSSDIETLHTNAVSLTSQAGVPSSTPSAVGQFNLDTTANRFYISTGTSSSADWDKVAAYAYGTETVTGGGGDVTVNLDWDWSGGLLLLFISSSASNYVTNNGASAMLWVTSYDSLTNGSYTDAHNMFIDIAPSERIKTSSISGMPNSATSNSFTLDDDGVNTRYVKWVVIA